MGGLKRIILTVTNDLSYDQRMQKICRSLAGAGYEVELVGRERMTSIPLANEPYRQTRLHCIINKGKFFYLEYNLRLAFYLMFSQFDAVCAVDLDTLAPVYSIGRLKGAKIVFDAHEYFTEVPEVVGRHMIKKIWQWVERTFVPNCDLIYTVSPGLAVLFERSYSKTVAVIMNLPVLEEEANLPDDENAASPKFILYQGALNEGRGLEQLIEAMKDVNLNLKLAGEGDLSGRLREQVRQIGLGQKVEFCGYVEPNRLKQFTRQAFIGVNLLQNKGLSYYYSLSNKFFDYIQARIPQLCIDFPEYRLINEKYDIALLIEDCSPKEIAAALNKLVTDAEIYSRLQKNCDVCRLDLNWQIEEKKLLGLYEQLFR